MEEENRENVKRDYDKEPIIIGNNFTSISFGITFFLLFNAMLVYMVFFGDAIDCSQNKEWYVVFKEEMSKSARFGTIMVGWPIVWIMALRTLWKNLKNPRKIIFKNSSIESDKSFNDLEKIELKDIVYIKRSLFPLTLTGYEKEGFVQFIGYIPAAIFVVLSGLILYINRLLIFGKYDFPFFTIFSKKTHRVLNIHIVFKDDYREIKRYFLEKLDIDIDEIEINFKLSNIKGENDSSFRSSQMGIPTTTQTNKDVTN